MKLKALIWLFLLHLKLPFQGICQKIKFEDKRIEVGTVWSQAYSENAGFYLNKFPPYKAMYYYNMEVPFWGTEISVLSSVPLWKGLKTELGFGYRLNGLQARHYVGADTTSQLGTDYRYRFEEWSKFYMHNFRFSVGLGYNFNNILRLKGQFTGHIPIYIQERRKSVRLSEQFYAGTEIQDVKHYNASKSFRKFNWGYEFSLEHPLNNRFSAFGTYYFSDTNGYLTDHTETEVLLFLRNITFGFIYKF